MSARPSRSPTVQSVAAALLALIPEDVRRDLRAEDPADAVEMYFGPIGCQALSSRNFAAGDCSIDGYYVSNIDVQPWIFYADDVHPHRVRFTLLHELGHHLFVTVAARLLDDLDVLGGSTEGAMLAEEAVCHRFAATLLVPDELLTGIIRDEPIIPQHVVSVHDAAAASWEAVAIRVAEVMPMGGAVVIVRDEEVVSFAASSPRLGTAWWSRGSALSPDGPLARALRLRQTAQRELYRYGLGYAMAMFCDTLPVHDGLGIGVLSEKPSDGRLSIIEQPEPAWKERAFSASGALEWSGIEAGATGAEGRTAQSVTAAAAATLLITRCVPAASC